MPVFTVMADNAEGEPEQLHRQASSDAAKALSAVELFRSKNLRDIRVFRETEEITLMELLSAVAAERARTIKFLGSY